MAPLPKSRIQQTMRAFERVGVDYGGPYLTKQGQGKTRVKRYQCLFTCFATRVVNLKMAYALDTNSFINALSRMVARTGTLKYVLSDDGTSFVGSEQELREFVEALDQKKIASKTTCESGVEWKFNPPSVPHFGGVFEAMIKSAKKSMRAILGNAEIFNPRMRWHRVQQLLGQFWKRWRREFLPSLNARKKWFHPNHNLKKDDVVMVVDKQAKKAEWPLGRVVEAFPGVEGLV